MRTVPLRVIGVVRSARTSPADSDWGRVESRIELDPELAPGLEGLDQFSHALVLFHMHLVPESERPVLRRHPRDRADMPELGVFAQRARMRPNHVGVTACEIVRVEPAAVIVRGLDAIDGTPVLDLKPYVPDFDRRDARVPEWMARLMKGYF